MGNFPNYSGYIPDQNTFQVVALETRSWPRKCVVTLDNDLDIIWQYSTLDMWNT